MLAEGDMPLEEIIVEEWKLFVVVGRGEPTLPPAIVIREEAIVVVVLISLMDCKPSTDPGVGEFPLLRMDRYPTPPPAPPP